MRIGPSIPALTFAAFAGFFAAAWPAGVWESGRQSDELRDVLRDQEAGDRTTSNDAIQRIGEKGGAYTVEYGFTNFNKDRLDLKFEFDKRAYAEYAATYGYSTREIEALKAWRQTANKEAFAKAVAAHKNQAQLDAAVAGVTAEYGRKLKDYLASRRFILQKDNSVDVDMPRFVRENGPLVNSLALQLDAVAQKKRYEQSDLIDALASLVQTAMIYKVPPNVEGDMHTGGILPPVTSLLKGWGDCDTKTAVLASILSHWPQIRMVGVAVPDHYLMAVLKVPLKGDLIVTYHGTPFVLVEPAGPAWLPPGSVAASTADLLAGPEAYQLEPFFTE